MSFNNPSDFNGDGRTNYVDYQIYNNYIDPQSSQYQGDMFPQTPRTYYPRQKSGLEFIDYVIIIAVFLVLFFIILATPLAEVPELAAIVVMGLTIIFMVFYFKWKKKGTANHNQQNKTNQK